MPAIREWRRGQFLITTDPQRLDLAAIQQFLSEHSYWADGITLDAVRRSIENALTFGLFDADRQIGFARVISDYATFAYLSDVFILPAHRGRGLSKWLMGVIMSHPDVQGLRRWVLATQDAHGLYRQFGFKQLAHPEYFMEVHDPIVYKRCQDDP